MSFHLSSSLDEQAPLSEINMVPLIDVMMVLLVIFLVTAPLMTQAVKVTLPHVSSRPDVPEQLPINIAIDSTGALYWNQKALDADALQQHLQALSQQTPVPPLRLHADRTTPYERVAWVLAEASRLGISQIGLVTVPENH